MRLHTLMFSGNDCVQSCTIPPFIIPNIIPKSVSQVMGGNVGGRGEEPGEDIAVDLNNYPIIVFHKIAFHK